MNTLNLKRFKFILTMLASSPAILLVYSPFLIFQTSIGTAIPLATGRFIDALAYQHAFWWAFSTLAFLLFLKSAMDPLLQRFICSRARAIETDLQFRVLDAAMSLHPSRFAEISNGELIAKLSRDTFVLGGFVRNFYPRFLQAVVTMVAASCVLYSRSATLALSFMAFFPLVLFLFLPFARRFAATSHRVRGQSDASFRTLFDFFLTLPLLRTLDAERRFADTPQTAFKELKNSNDESDRLSVCFGFLLGIILVGGEIAVLGVAGSLAAKGAIPIGDVVLYQILFITAIQSIEGVICLLPELASLREGIDSLGELLERTPPETGHIHIKTIDHLAFKHVSFAYPCAATRPIIKDFSATFHANTIVGLSGVNGSGKSTLLKLAIQALEPQEGEILVNGHPFSEIDHAAFRRRLGIVFQDNPIITGTIRDNITLRDPAFTQDDIDKALAMSGFDVVVKRFPDGLDTCLGNTTRTLSGGERQRLALARAIIRNPLILVLDEATNHLDAESRKNVATLVTRLRPGRLILLAGHDAALDKLCDMKISCQT